MSWRRCPGRGILVVLDLSVERRSTRLRRAEGPGLDLPQRLSLRSLGETPSGVLVRSNIPVAEPSLACQPVLTKRRSAVGHLAVRYEAEPGDDPPWAPGVRERDDYLVQSQLAETSI